MNTSKKGQRITTGIAIAGVLITFLSLLRDLFGLTSQDIGISIPGNTFFLTILGMASSLVIGRHLGLKYGMSFFRRSLLQSEIQSFSDSIHNTLRNINGSTKDIFTGIYRGWLKQLNDEVQDGGDKMIEIDGDYYERCLPEFEIESANIYAIADLTNDAEDFWFRMSPERGKVRERIFIINWFDFFDEKKLFRLANLFKKHSEIYSVKVNNISSSLNKIYLLKNRIGNHFFFSEPDFVGGYTLKENRKLLRVINNANSYRDAKSLYKQIDEKAIKYNPKWSGEDLRKEWISLNKIGSWDKNWDEIVEQRNPDYFINYDMHIRCWIPNYDDFILGTFHVIKHHTLNLFRESSNQLKILEIGYGTGALTRHILAWIELFEKPLRGTKNAVRYYGLDRAKKQMFYSSHYNIKESKRFAQFYSGVAFTNLPPEVHTKFDLVCASLVLHDLNTANPNPHFQKVLEELSKLVRSGGIVIFADLFWTNSTRDNNKRLETWKDYILKNLTLKETNQFLESNADMTNSLKESDAVRISKKFGFETKFKSFTYSSSTSPFKCMIMKKTT